jgi:hypothetical protein
MPAMHSTSSQFARLNRGPASRSGGSSVKLRWPSREERGDRESPEFWRRSEPPRLRHARTGPQEAARVLRLPLSAKKAGQMRAG